MSGAIRVLYVDDNPTSLRFRADLLARFDGMEIHTAADVPEGLRRLDESEFDCVLSALATPSKDGLAFLTAVRQRDAHLPFILFASAQSRASVSDALEADVTDFIVKRDVDEFQEVLVNRIEQFVAHYRVTKQLGSVEGIPSEGRGSPDAGG